MNVRRLKKLYLIGSLSSLLLMPLVAVLVRKMIMIEKVQIINQRI